MFANLGTASKFSPQSFERNISAPLLITPPAQTYLGFARDTSTSAPLQNEFPQVPPTSAAVQDKPKSVDLLTPNDVIT